MKWMFYALLLIANPAIAEAPVVLTCADFLKSPNDQRVSGFLTMTSFSFATDHPEDQPKYEEMLRKLLILDCQNHPHAFIDDREVAVAQFIGSVILLRASGASYEQIQELMAKGPQG